LDDVAVTFVTAAAHLTPPTFTACPAIEET
jgi:hypothetical protein